MIRIFLFILFIPSVASGQNTLTGHVFDEKNLPVAYATISLLHPEDSTLAFYSVSNENGKFDLRNVKDGTYILQTAFIGYKTFYKSLTFPGSSGMNIVIAPVPVNLPEAEVSEERIPLLIKGDTIEYNAISYKTQPDAVVEELLKKLPGIEVDRNGNIRAQGEDVRKVTIDGKEFFGNDPKIATKNLPADAIDKVRVFDRKTDREQLTGIDDGERDKTIDLSLRDDKKNAWFGEVQAGVGNENKYQASGKAYRFTPHRQIAALGMINNINKFGFSFSDYLSFTGAMRGGESISVNPGESNFPIDFGDMPSGLITSGASGINYSYEKKKDRRFYSSYLMNSADKKLIQNSNEQNFVGDQTFNTTEELVSNDKNAAHRFDGSWKNRIDSMKLFTMSFNVGMNSNRVRNNNLVRNYNQVDLLSDQQSHDNSSSNFFKSSLNAEYTQRLSGKWKSFYVNADVSWKDQDEDRSIISTTDFPGDDSTLNQFLHQKTYSIQTKFESMITYKTGTWTYVDGILEAGYLRDRLSNDLLLNNESDSTIAELKRLDSWYLGKVNFRRVKNKSRLWGGLSLKNYSSSNAISDQSYEKDEIYFLPSAGWEMEYKRSGRVKIFYEAKSYSPDIYQLYPFPLYFNPLQKMSGNRMLRPEIVHATRMHWSLFDQFSFTSFFSGLRFIYTHDKIGLSKKIDTNFYQQVILINIPDNYEGGASAEFSTPLRPLSMNINFSVDEMWKQSSIYINDESILNSTFVHEFDLKIDNRKKNKWDVGIGMRVAFVEAEYSSDIIADRNYSRTDLYADLNFNPGDRWHIGFKSDISWYSQEEIGNEIRIPLLRADVSFSFLKNKRGTLILEGFDLLNKNSGIERLNEYNYMIERRSNHLSRFFMLTFRYKLNKFTSKEKIDVKVR